MFDFFGELPLAVRFFMAFAAVMGLIGLFTWLVRRFGMNRLGGAAARGRQPRLAVIEHGQVDSRRKLVIVRRDNVEHLIMIGGPTDILIEANIVRGQAARDTTTARGAAAATTATTPAEPSTSWPLAPEPGTPRPRPAALEESLSWSLPAEPTVPAPPAPPPAPRRPAHVDPLAGLANELSRPAARVEPTVAAPRTAPTLDIPATRSTAPTLEIPMPKLDIPAPKPAAPQPPAAQPEAGDQNLSEMAQRLEAALRRPGGSPAAPGKPATPAPQPSLNPSLASTPRIDSVNGARDKAAKPEPAAEPEQGGAAFGSLEQEMANLLGRPTNKQ